MPTLEERIQARLQTRSAAPSAPIEDRIAARLRSRFGGSDTSSLATDGTPGPAFREEQDAAATPQPFVGPPIPPPKQADVYSSLGPGGMPYLEQRPTPDAPAVVGPPPASSMFDAAANAAGRIVPNVIAGVDTFAHHTIGNAAEGLSWIEQQVGILTPQQRAQYVASLNNRYAQRQAQMGDAAASLPTAPPEDATGIQRLGYQAAEFGGGIAPYLAAGGVGPAVALGTVSGTGSAATEYQRELEGKGMDPARAAQLASYAAPLAGAVEGVVNAVQAEKIASRLGLPADGVKRWVAHRALDAAIGAGLSAGSDAASQAGGMAIGAQDGFDLNRSLAAIQSGAVGQSVMGAVSDAVGRLAARPATPEVEATTRAGTPGIPPAETGTPAGVSGPAEARDGIVLTSAEALDAARAIRERQTGRRDLSPPATGVVAPTDSAPAAVAPTGTIDDVRAFAAAKRQRDAIRQAAADLDAKIASALGLAPGTDVGAVLDRATVKAEPSKGGAPVRPVGEAESLMNELRVGREGRAIGAANEQQTNLGQVASIRPDSARSPNEIRGVADRVPDTTPGAGVEDGVQALVGKDGAPTGEKPGNVADNGAQSADVTAPALDSMTPAQLRREAKARGVDSRGTKAQLLERLKTPPTEAPKEVPATTPRVSPPEPASETLPVREPSSQQEAGPRTGSESTASPNPTPATGAKEAAAPGKRAVSGSEGGGEKATPTTADRAVSKLDKIAADAQERIKQRGGVQRGKGFKGSRSGETTLIGDTVDAAVVVAAKAVSSAIRGGQALTRLVESTIKELGVTADRDHVRRIARGLIRDTLAEKPENHADAFERAAGALRDKYSREPKASEIKPLIRENTGQTPQEKTITEPQALRASMSKAEKAASIAYRAGEADATARGKAELADLVQKLNARTMEKEDARKELVRIVRETVPLSERGKLLTRIRDASNSDDVAAGVDMARDVIALYEGRQANSFVRSNSGKGLTNKMTQANRDAVQAARGIASAAWQKLQDASNVAERRQAADELITAQNQIKAAMHDQKIGERVLIGGQKIDAAIAREDLSNGIRATGKLRPTDELGNVKEEGKSGKALATLQDPVTLMRTVDGKADGSGVASKLWTDIRAAYTRASGRIQKARDMAHEAAIQAGYNGIGDLLEKVSGTRGEQGRKFIEVGVGGRKKLTLGEAMKLYAMDPETKEQVINGRKINWDNSRTAPAFNVTAADFAAIARALTPEQRKLVNALKAIRESFRGDLAKAHKRLKGFEPPWVEQYEPRRVNPEGTDPGKALGGSATEQLLEDAGFLKAREGGITPLLVGDFLTDWTRSIDGMARFTEMAEPLRAARLVLQDPRTKGVVTKYKGEYANKLVDQLFSQFGSAASDSNALSGLGSKIIGNVSKAATQLNPRSWGRQLGGVLAAASEAPPDVVAAGMPMMFNRGVRERMVENSPYLAARASMPDALRFHDLEQPGAVRGQRTIQGMARVFGDAVTSLKRGDVKDAAKNASDAFNFIRAASYMDEAPAAMLWAGFEAKAQKEGKGVDWIRENVERIMQSTQNPSESIDGALMKSVAKGTWFEPFTAFKGDSTKAYNRLKRAAEEGGFKSRTFWKAASGVLASALWSGVVTALLGNQTLKLVGGAVTGNADDEDTQKRLKNAVLMGADQTLRDVAGVVPIVGDNLYEWTLGSFIRPHGGAMQNAFDNPTSGSLSRLAIGMNGFGRGVYRTLTAEDEDTREKAGKALLKSLESAAEGAASATGIPLGPVYGMGKALVQGARGDAEK